MRFTELEVPGVHLVEAEPARDDRGLFVRTFCQRELAARGLQATFVQESLSVNDRKGTLRGLHYQAEPHGEVKLLRCARGALFAVVADLRPGSGAFGRWCAVTLRARGPSLYVPRGCANGFQTLEDDTEVVYLISTFYEPSSARGIRWDDPRLAIDWPPAERRILSPRDASLPDLETALASSPVPRERELGG